MTELRLCERECTYNDETPRLASHGRYCSRCWGRLDMPLAQSAELVAHIIGNITPGASGGGDRVDGTRDAPLPFNQSAFDDASELYSMLVYWSLVWANGMRVTPPAVARGAWRTEAGKVIGLPVNVTAERAAELIDQLAQWIRFRLDTILGTVDFDDDIEAFTDQIGDVWRMNARWPRIEKPSYSQMPCPREDCKARMAVYPPAFPGDARRIVCTAGHWYPEEEYEHLKQVFDQVSEERARTIKVANRLTKKYGLGV